MLKSAKTLYLGSAILAASLLLGAGYLALRSPSVALAQTGTGTITAGESTRVEYSSKYINMVVPSRRDDEIREVYPFPNGPVFLVRTNDAITVWVREDTSIRMLLQIKLEEKFEEIHFLDDNRTFIILTDKAARVYTVDRNIIRQQQQVTRR